MTFIREKLSDADMEYAKSFGIFSQFSPLLSKWVVDRDRNAFLVCVGGRPWSEDMPGEYAFVWQGHVIKFKAHITAGPKTNKSTRTVRWNVFGVQVPDLLSNCTDKILELISEAITADTDGMPSEPNVKRETQIEISNTVMVVPAHHRLNT